MFIRQTKTSNSVTGEAYTTFRLVASERVGGKVRQQTLLNLSKNFDLPKEDWPLLCARIEQILAGQLSLLPATETIEKQAQHYAARLVTGGRGEHQKEDVTSEAYHRVDIESLTLVQPRSIGVEHVGMAALHELQLPKILEEVGLNGVQRAAAIGSIIEQARGNKSSYLSFLDHLLEEEVAAREGRRIQTAMKTAGLPAAKTIEEYDFSFHPQLDKAEVMELTTRLELR